MLMSAIGSDGQMVAITSSRQRRGLIGGNPPSFITPHFEFPFIQLQTYNATKSCTRRQPSKWRMIDSYLEFWEPSPPDFKETIDSFRCICREA